jgi:hypothetical protein
VYGAERDIRPRRAESLRLIDATYGGGDSNFQDCCDETTSGRAEGAPGRGVP